MEIKRDRWDGIDEGGGWEEEEVRGTHISY